MNLNTRTRQLLATLTVVVATLSFANVTLADPPSRAARIGYMQGAVSFAPAGDQNWVVARLNRPITLGDSIWTDNNGRTELQFGAATVRLDEFTSVQLLNLDDRTIQLQLAQGRINVNTRTLRNGETIEIATPNLAFTIYQAGDYRIDVDPRDNATTVSVRRGAGDVYGEGEAFTLRSKDAARFYGTDLREREFYALAPRDDFDRWANDRDRRADRSVSARYVSTEVIGYSDLDQYGTWSSQPTYGNVWFPSEVSQEWAPYRYGHWSWVDPWGWSWVDDAPWGFAPFHYGRWSNFSGRWGWVPGPVNVRPVYAPALVAFVGGANFSLTVSSGSLGNGIGWFPLAPGEVYRPAYAASRDYVRNVNVSNTVVNTTVINNIYNNQTNVTQVNYRNAQVANAVTAVPPAVFAQSQSVQRSMVAVSPDLLRRGQVTTMAAVAPTAVGIAGGAPATNNRPARSIVEREVVVRTAPPAAVAPVAQRVDLLQRAPGQPLERAAIVATTPSPAAANVRVVDRQTPQAVPQGTPRGAGAPPPMVQRSADDVGRPASQPGRGNTPAASTPAAAPAAPTVAAPPAAMPSRERGIGAPAGAAPAPMAPQQVAPPPVTPRAPQATPQDERGRPPQSGQSSDRARGEQGNRPSTVQPPAAAAPAPTPAPAAVAPPPVGVAPAPVPRTDVPTPRVAPAPEQRTDAPATQPMTRQRDQGPSSRPMPPPQAAPQAAPQPAPQAAPQAPQRPAPQAAPQATPQERPAPPAGAAPPQSQRPAPAPSAAPAPTPRPAPAAAPPGQPQAAPTAPQGGDQNLQRRGRGNPDDKEKDKKKDEDKK